MTNTIKITRKDGDTTTTGINPDCTTKEVKDYYSNQNFLCSCQDSSYNQVVQIEFFKGFKDMLTGERSLTSIARYNNEAQCYLF